MRSLRQRDALGRRRVTVRLAARVRRVPRDLWAAEEEAPIDARWHGYFGPGTTQTVNNSNFLEIQ